MSTLINKQPRNLIIWAMIVVFASFKILQPLVIPGGVFDGIITLASVIILLVFVFIHGSRQIGWLRIMVFFILAFLISWSYESLSIATGFPFGHYHFSSTLGIKLGRVPLLIMPCYFVIGYLSWLIAALVIQRIEPSLDIIQTLIRPIVATFIMVMWDLGIDPGCSTFSKSWIWEQGGSYFGVPISNFFGLSICVWTILQLFALILYVLPVKRIDGAKSDRRENWWQAVALYATIALGSIVLAIFPPAGSVTDLSGIIWNVSAMYQTMGLVTIFTMCFVVVISSVSLVTMPIDECR